MPDYSHYKIKTLDKMRDAAWDKYYAETSKVHGNWGDGMRLSKLPQCKAWERAKECYEDICTEIRRRKTIGM